MKVRIKPYMTVCSGTAYEVQIKRWWGWKTIASYFSIKGALEFKEDLKLITNVEFVDYV